MRALVTGGAGFIGSHLVDALVRDGHDVTVVDDLSRGKRDQVNAAARFEQRDITDPALGELFTSLRPEVVFHQAAQIDVRVSVGDPLLDAHVNVVGTVNVLRAASEAGAGRVVFASSGGAMYGDTDVIPTPETLTPAPSSPYGAAKVAGEVYGRMFEQLHGLGFVALRYANVYGPRQDPHGEAGVVAIFCERLLRQERAVINGDGSQTRDYVYVEDVVAANLLALRLDSGGAFNVGTGVETDVNRLHAGIASACGVLSQPEHGPAKAGEQRRSCLAVDHAARVLGWSPQVSLTEGLRRTSEYFQGVAAPARGSGA